VICDAPSAPDLAEEAANPGSAQQKGAEEEVRLSGIEVKPAGVNVLSKGGKIDGYYLCISRTSYFRVKDEEEFRRVVDCILGDVDIWEQIGDDGIKRFAIGGYDNLTVFEVGHEKLRYVCGWVCMITAKEIRYMDLHQWEIEQCKQIGILIPQMGY